MIACCCSIVWVVGEWGGSSQEGWNCKPCVSSVRGGGVITCNVVLEQ